MALFQLYKTQKLDASVDELWDFISSPKNLKEITPDYMGFEITTPDLPEKMYTGMIIAYKVSPILNLKLTWVTEITHVEDKVFFIDEQRMGPYKLWHHQHRLAPQDRGVLMTDLVSYRPPMGFLGTIAKHLFIGKQLEDIFEYRRQKLDQIFGEIKT